MDKKIIKRYFSTFEGKFLEKLFIELLKQQQIYTKIRCYWERGNKNEIDIVALDELNKRMLICGVKLSKKRLNRDELIKKSIKLVNKFKDYKIEYAMYCIDDLDLFLG